MKRVLHRATTRGYFDHGWLKTFHTFSFAGYQDPIRTNFGALRVLNDDRIAPGTGFGMHPHRDMEVISIPLSGNLEHKNSLGHSSVISQGEIQVMSAGSGIRHSEYNPDPARATEFLQIWVTPDRINVEPRYISAAITDILIPNELTEIISPYPGNGKGLWIHQQAWFSMGNLSAGTCRKYTMKSPGSLGAYVFIINGKAIVANEVMEPRDGMEISQTIGFDIEATEDTRILVIEVP